MSVGVVGRFIYPLTRVGTLFVISPAATVGVRCASSLTGLLQLFFVVMNFLLV